MRENLSRTFGQYGRTFSGFTMGQKAVSVIGAVALLLGAFLVFRWASAPSYAPLYSDLSASDASSVVEELDKTGVKYELANGGTTVMVPQADVYSARIALSGQGLPASSGESGYSLLDGQGLSTSDFQEQTTFKRAMEGELAKTIEAINGVDTAVVHLAIPEKQVFTDDQNPTTASVLVKTKVGSSLSADQVDSMVHLVANSVDGLDAKDVSVSDSSGKLLTTRADSAAGAASTQAKEVNDFQGRMQTQIQSVLDRVLGAGNATSNVTADLNFDKTTTKKRTYTYTANVPPLSETSSVEKYNGTDANGTAAVGGTVGPDGQMDPGAGTTDGPSDYENSTETKDNPVNHVDEETEAAPGQVRSLHIGVVLDANKVGQIQPADVRNVIAAATGIDTTRGDTIDVSTMPFDRTSETTAAEELLKAEAEAAAAQRWIWIRNGGLIALVALIILLAWIKARRRAKARDLATNYVVEQLRTEAEARAQAAELDTAQMLAELESSAPTPINPADQIRDELNALVESQPDDVATLLRGWLVGKP